ncbi:zinc finger protein OZF [Anabrus simplex]|uniref:zinc finger protein OZF n=1 Tax=Anabrus simplex TaxID=316456 RepID=UPI0035A2F681
MYLKNIGKGASHLSRGFLNSMEEPHMIKRESGWLKAAGETSALSPPDIKIELFIEKHADDQMLPALKEFKKVENVAVLTAAPVELRHIMRPSTHTVEEPYFCSICNRALAEESLDTHLMVAHSLLMPFECSICGSTFVYLSNLRKHGIEHTMKMPFRCSNCGRTFKMSAHLKKHEELKQCHVRPFRCSKCGKAFRKLMHRRRHEELHSDDRSFSCSICQKTFATLKYLIGHKKIHIDRRPFSCFCGRTFRKSNNAFMF